MTNGTIHTFRDTEIVALLAKFNNWARIERMDVQQPLALIVGDNDG